MYVRIRRTGPIVLVFIHLAVFVSALRADPVTLARISEAQSSDGLLHFSQSMSVDGDTAVVSTWEDGRSDIDVYKRVSGQWRYVTRIAQTGPQLYSWNWVAISGTTIAVIGYTNADAEAINLFIYEESPSLTWTLTQNIPLGNHAETTVGPIVMRGSQILIGVPIANVAIGLGEVWAFERSDGVWSRTAVLKPADPSEGDSFGTSVDISGDTAVVGAEWHPVQGRRIGAAYVFVRRAGTWSQVARLTETTVGARASYGAAVAIYGPVIAIGAPGDIHSDTAAGSVFTYVKQGQRWRKNARLLPSADRFSWFGQSLSLRADKLIIGMRNDDSPSPYKGVASVFEYSSGAWAETARLVHNDPDNVAVRAALILDRSDSGDVFVSSPNDSIDNHQLGAIYVFTQSDGNWISADNLYPTNHWIGDSLGSSVSLSGDLLALGTKEDLAFEEDAGAVHVYRGAGPDWNLESVLTSPHPQTGERFGTLVSVDGDTIAVTDAPDDASFGAGRPSSVYVYRLIDGIWAQVAELMPAETSGTDPIMSLVLKGSTIVAAASPETHRTDTGHWGSVYVFREVHGQWRQTQTILPPASFDSIGSALDLDHGNLLINVGTNPQTSDVAWYQNTDGLFAFKEIFAGGPFTSGLDLNENRAALRQNEDILIYQFAAGHWNYVNRVSGVDLGPFAFDDDTLVGRVDRRWTTFREQAGAWLPGGNLPLPLTVDKRSSSAVINSPLIVVATPADSTVAFEAGSATVFDAGPPPADLVLTVDGTCPGGGRARAQWANATPGGTVTLVAAATTGSYVIPQGRACAGVILGLGSDDLRILYTGPAGADGSRSISGVANAELCGHFVQLLDKNYCALSNVAQVQ